MDANTIVTLIGSLGFPIVACIGMAYFFAKANDNYRNDIKESNQLHKQEMDAMTEAINNNTLVLSKLIDRLDKEEGDDGK